MSSKFNIEKDSYTNRLILFHEDPVVQSANIANVLKKMRQRSLAIVLKLQLMIPVMIIGYERSN